MSRVSLSRSSAFLRSDPGRIFRPAVPAKLSFLGERGIPVPPPLSFLPSGHQNSIGLVLRPEDNPVPKTESTIPFTITYSISTRTAMEHYFNSSMAVFGCNCIQVRLAYWLCRRGAPSAIGPAANASRFNLHGFHIFFGNAVSLSVVFPVC